MNGMKILKRKRKFAAVTETELSVLRAVEDLGPCSLTQVHHYFGQSQDILPVMRALHALVDKGFLRSLVIKNMSVYRTSYRYTIFKKVLNKQP